MIAHQPACQPIPSRALRSADSTETASAEAAENADNEPQTAVITEEQAAPAPVDRAAHNLGGVSRQLGRVIGATSIGLEKATDEASAKAALAGLDAASNSLGEVAEQVSAMPEILQAPIKNVVGQGYAKLKPLADTTLTKDGVGSVIGPVVGSIMETMSNLSE